MLHVTRLTTRTGGYYLEDLAAELGPLADPTDRRGRDAGSPGRWVGDGARDLGLAGPADGRALAALLDGRAPSSGRRLLLRPSTVTAFDLTFSAPKSASVLVALGPHDAARDVLDAQRVAVAGALDYVARHAAAAQRSVGGERFLVAVDGLAGASFTHGVSRALDPHLHTHVVVANLAHGEDGRWSTLDARGLSAHAAAAGALSDAALRHELAARLGVAWDTRPDGRRELDGIDDIVLGGLSSRRAQIRERLGDAGASRHARRVVWAATRDPKEPGRTAAELRGRWASQAAALGCTPDDVAAVLGRHPRRSEVLDEHRFAAALHTSTHPAAARRDVVAAWAGALEHGATPESVGACVKRLADWGAAVGVGEARRALAGLVPSPAQLRELGPRPSSPDALDVWSAAARRIDAYRARWGVRDPRSTFGVEGAARGLSTLPTRRIADHLSAVHDVEAARRRLGRPAAREAAVPERSRGHC